MTEICNYVELYHRGKEKQSVKMKNKKSLLGNDLLSQKVALQVPSALAGLTTGFGMGPGVPPPLQSPRRLLFNEQLEINNKQQFAHYSLLIVN